MVSAVEPVTVPDREPDPPELPEPELLPPEPPDPPAPLLVAGAEVLR